jgi:hypothetical protein
MVDLNRQHLAFPLTRVVRQKGVPEVAKSESLRFCEVNLYYELFGSENGLDIQWQDNQKARG